MGVRVAESVGGGGENMGLETLLPLCVHPNETAIPWRRI